MQYMGDVESRDSAEKLIKKLNQRTSFVKLAGLFIPPIHTQLGFNNLAKSDAKNYTNYLIELEKFHERKRIHFYPKIFTTNSIDINDWKDLSLKFFNEQRKISVVRLILPLITAILILNIWSIINFRKLLKINTP